jgi:hypothetical protein
VVSTTPRPLYSQERPGTHCRGGWVGPRAGLDVCEKSRPHREFFFRSPVRPARSQSLYRLSYPTHVARDTNLTSSTSCCGQLPSREVHHFRLDFNDTNHWAAKCPSRRYDVLPSQGTTSRSFYFCEDYGVGLCLFVLQTGSHKTPRMSVYHGAKVNRNSGAL